MNWIKANWRTAATGIGAALLAVLTLLAALPYELGDVATVIPPEWKAKVFVISAVAAFLLRIINSLYQRDANVTSVASGLQDVEPKAQAKEVVTPKD